MKKTMLFALIALLCGAPKFAQASNDGVPSTGSITIVGNSALSAATATGTLQILDVASLYGTVIKIGSYSLRAGLDYIVGASTAATAVNLTAAINAYPANLTGTWPYVPVVASYSAGQTVITLTAIDVGSAYNAVALLTTNSAEITVSGAALTGGQNNAVVSINSVALVAGRDWFILDVASDTAISLSAAINHAAGLGNFVKGYALGGAAVTLRSVLTPAAYPLAAQDNSSNHSNITLSGPTMTGGSAGQQAQITCDVGNVNALPTSNIAQGCKAYLLSDPTHIYIATQPVVGSQSWLAK